MEGDIFMIISMLSSEEINLLNLNRDIQKHSDRLEYHMNHIKLVKQYALIINKRLGYNISERKLSYAALSHDLFKEHGLNPKDIISKYPQDLNKYVRENISTLDVFELGDYFNTVIGYHPLAAGIYLYNNLGIKDPEILYPVMFHSCPIMDVYNTLPFKTRTMIDIIAVSDKLSSNYLRINMLNEKVRVDLDQVMFGSSGREFNYTLGLFVARLISQGKKDDEYSKVATDYYYKRLSEANPFISKMPNIKKLGENKIWEKRKSQALMIH